MENKALQFKTSLNCGGCVAKVQNELDRAAGAGHWNVDTEHADKLLTVNNAEITEDEVISIVKSKGFIIERVAG